MLPSESWDQGYILLYKEDQDFLDRQYSFYRKCRFLTWKTVLTYFFFWLSISIFLSIDSLLLTSCPCYSLMALNCGYISVPVPGHLSFQLYSTMRTLFLFFAIGLILVLISETSSGKDLITVILSESESSAYFPN